MGIPLDKITHRLTEDLTTSATADETVPAKAVLPQEYTGASYVWVQPMGEDTYVEGGAYGRTGFNFPTAATEILDSTTVAASTSVKLTDSLYVVGLVVANTSFTAYAVSVDGTTLTAGSAVQVNGGTNGTTATDTDSVSMCRISDTVFAAVYRDEAGDDYICARCGTVSGTTITMGTEVVIYSAGAATEDETACCYVNGCLVAAFADTDDDLGVIATPTSTAGVIGTPGSIDEVSGEAPSMVSIAPCGANKVFLAYADGADGLLDGCVATVSAAGVVAAGTPADLHAKAPTMTRVRQLATDKVAVGYIESTTSNDPYVVVCTVSTTTITAGTPVAIAAATATDFDMDIVDDTLGYVAWCDDAHGSDVGYISAFSMSSTTVTASSVIDKFVDSTAKLGTLPVMGLSAGNDDKVFISYAGTGADLYAIAGQYHSDNRIVDVRSGATSATYDLLAIPIFSTSDEIGE